MNIDDVKSEPIPSSNIISAIFDRQRELMEKYDKIERDNGAIVPEPPFSIDDKYVQWRIKDLFWRTTEELSEMLEEELTSSEIDHWPDVWDSSSTVRHFYEEFADSLHFFVEASIMVGVDPKQIEHLFSNDQRTWVFSDATSVYLDCMRFIRHMGLAANCLKIKPWKSTHMATDKSKFIDLMLSSWSSFDRLRRTLNVSQEQLYNLYFKKSRVNDFRIESNY